MANKTTNREEKVVELLEKNLIVNLYLAGANRDQIKSVVGVGTNKTDKIISIIKSLRKENKNGRTSKWNEKDE